MDGSMRIESAGPQGNSTAGVKLCVEGYRPVYAQAETVAQALVNLTRDPSLPLHVLEWLVPRGAVFDEPHGLRDELSRLRQEHHDLRAAVEAAKAEAQGWRRVVDMLLDRLEGKGR